MTDVETLRLCHLILMHNNHILDLYDLLTVTTCGAFVTVDKSRYALDETVPSI